MNPANYREALLETAADEAEGADILLVMLLLYITVACYENSSFCGALKPWFPLTGETRITILGYHPTSS